MNERSKKKLHYWIVQLRRPICALVAVSLVIFWGISTYAANLTFSNYEDFYIFTGFDPDLSYPAITLTNVQTFAENDNYDGFSNVTGGIFNYTPSGVNASQFQEWQRQMIAASGRNFPKTLTIDGLDFDISSCYWLITSPSSGTSQIMLFWGTGQIAMVDDYVVSEQPFYLTRNSQSFTAGYWAFNGVPNYAYVSTPSDNGFYCFDIRSSWYYCGTNLSIYASSSDGNSGFTNFSLTSTDFDFSENNYDFNFYKTGLGVIAGSDPEPLPDVSQVEANAYHNMAVTMRTSYAGPVNNASAICHFNYGWNNYILTYPNLFKQLSDYNAKLIYVTATGTESELDFTFSSEYNIEMILNQRNHMTNDGSKFSEPLLFSEFEGWTDALGSHDLLEQLNTAQALITGASPAYGSWLSLFEQVVNGTTANLFGIDPDYLWTPNNNRGIKEFYITGEHYIASVSDNHVLKSGVYKDKVDFVQNDYFVLTNDIPNNNYPYEEAPPSSLPSGNIENNTLYPNGSGSVNNTNNNISVFSNLNAQIEYLFNLDASDLSNVTGNVANTVQYVVNEITDTSHNGFWSVLKRTYDVIPEPIWTWIYTTIGVLLSGAVFSWVYNGVRIKRG